MIYLGDRGSFSVKTFKYFDSIGITYNIRIKGDIWFRSIHGRKKGHSMLLNELPTNVFTSRFFNNVYLTKQEYRCNTAVSRMVLYENGTGLDDIWYVATNAVPRRAIKDYGYRFSIETVFKNMKSNGFYLEKTAIRNLRAFNSLFGIICLAVTRMTIIGTDLTKN